MKLFAAILTASSLAAFGGAFAAECEALVFDGKSYTVCSADPARVEIRLFLSDAEGAFLGTFDNLERAVADEGLGIAFAMNGGMYHPDRRPVGLYVEDGDELAPIVTREGPGNFALLPNGVLCLQTGSAAIVESRVFAASPPDCAYATQSGPMLVINGALHPRFLSDSTSRNIRNGVGIARDGLLYAAISDEPVTFHEFARLFRDRLETPNALFLDGRVSRLYAPGIGRHDIGFPMGPILGVLHSGN